MTATTKPDFECQTCGAKLWAFRNPDGTPRDGMPFCLCSMKANERPIDVVLPCPRCGVLHVDAPDPAAGWTNPPHRSHLCKVEDGGCGLIWRPADIPTNGVAAVKTKGENDTPDWSES